MIKIQKEKKYFLITDWENFVVDFGGGEWRELQFHE